VGNRREGDHWGDLGEEGWIILGWIWVGKRREGDHWGDLGVDGWIILGWILVGKPEGRRSLRRPSCRWMDNIIMYLGGETGVKETTGET